MVLVVGDERRGPGVDLDLDFGGEGGEVILVRNKIGLGRG